MNSRKFQLGFTMLEFIVVVCLISVIFIFAVERLLRLEQLAEKAAVQQLVGILQSALAMEIAAHVARDKIKDLDKFIASNPMALLSEVPHNYRGHVPPLKIENIKPAQWYFDSAQGVLIYQVSNIESFKSKSTENYQIKLKILPVYDDNNHNERFDPGLDSLRGLRLGVLEPYTWQGVAYYGNELLQN